MVAWANLWRKKEGRHRFPLRESLPCESQRRPGTSVFAKSPRSSPAEARLANRNNFKPSHSMRLDNPSAIESGDADVSRINKRSFGKSIVALKEILLRAAFVPGLPATHRKQGRLR